MKHGDITLAELGTQIMVVIMRKGEKITQSGDNGRKRKPRVTSWSSQRSRP